MKGRATIKQVAQAAGVSVATASVALNDKPGVSEQTRERVVQVARELNYVANDSARFLKTLRSNNLGLIVPDIENPFYGSLVRAFNHHAEQYGYRILLGVSEEDSNREAELINALVGKGVDGILLAPAATSYQSPGHLRMLQRLRVPTLFCTSYVPGIDAPCVMCDLRRGAYEMVSYLLRRGCRRIFLLTTERSMLYSQWRIDGYRQAFADAGLVCDPSWIYETNPRLEFGYQFVRQAWKRRPDAIFAINDFMAMGVMKALREMHVRIPEDVSVAGCDDLIFSQLMAVPLSTVQQPVEQMCERSVKSLVSMIEHGEHPEPLQLLEPQMRVRNTTR